MTTANIDDVFENSILTNIKRKSTFVDKVVMHNKMPLFSWIDINPTELCNRTCEFCPRHDPATYPNQNLHMSLTLANKLAQELKDLEYQGGLIICGHGEPLLHPKIVQLVAAFGDSIHTEIVTNGDRLTLGLLKDLFAAGLSYLLVSLYDGPHQVDEMKALFDEAGISDDRFCLRDRWHTVEEDFGLKLTNRAGTVNTGHQPELDNERPSYYTHYSMQIEWNGDVLVCVQDWNKRIRFGNVNHQTLLEVWQNKIINKYRRHLGKGLRRDEPCKNCNVNGTLHGESHMRAWMS